MSIVANTDEATWFSLQFPDEWNSCRWPVSWRSQPIVTLTISGLPHDPRPIGYQPFPLSLVPPTLKVFCTDIP